MSIASCPITTQKKLDSTILSVHCKQCKKGHASIQDHTCRKEIFLLLQHHPDTTQLILNHTFIKVYKDSILQYLKELSHFKEDAHINEYTKKLSVQQQERKKNLSSKKNKPDDDTCLFSKFQEFRKHPSVNPSSTAKRIRLKTPLLHQLPESLEANEFYHDFIRPYVRPGFIDSFIQLQPPPTAIFESTYTIESGLEELATVTLYSLQDSPEKLYFLLPYEYQITQQE
ncbi:MAG: hypothetical protein QCI00_09905, partial [Candidatus Thermoplasmatota archaeon]|nr:hypothetical protein [Candidatus Thermoplasmatota archaeon]